MQIKFYQCKHCGNIIAYAKSSGVKVSCCGEPMEEMIPNTTDAAQEKQIPVWTQEGNKVSVTVGSTLHPMTPEHYIQWICLQTKEGNQRKELAPNTDPKACFMLCDGDEVEAVYAYCNLHGFWKG